MVNLVSGLPAADAGTTPDSTRNHQAAVGSIGFRRRKGQQQCRAAFHLLDDPMDAGDRLQDLNVTPEAARMLEIPGSSGNFQLLPDALEQRGILTFEEAQSRTYPFHVNIAIGFAGAG